MKIEITGKIFKTELHRSNPRISISQDNGCNDIVLFVENNNVFQGLENKKIKITIEVIK